MKRVVYREVPDTTSSWPQVKFTDGKKRDRRREEVPLTAQPTGYDTTHGDGCYRAYVPPEGER